MACLTSASFLPWNLKYFEMFWTNQVRARGQLGGDNNDFRLEPPIYSTLLGVQHKIKGTKSHIHIPTSTISMKEVPFKGGHCMHFWNSHSEECNNSVDGLLLPPPSRPQKVHRQKGDLGSSEVLQWQSRRTPAWLMRRVDRIAEYSEGRRKRHLGLISPRDPPLQYPNGARYRTKKTRNWTSTMGKAYWSILAPGQECYPTVLHSTAVNGSAKLQLIQPKHIQVKPQPCVLWHMFWHALAVSAVANPAICGWNLVPITKHWAKGMASTSTWLVAVLKLECSKWDFHECPKRKTHSHMF